MNTDPTKAPEEPLDVEDLRPHVYDGIQEYDKRLPNWWLFTLYGAIVFSIGYWSLLHHWRIKGDPGDELKKAMEKNTLIAARSSGALNDDQLWQMSRDQSVISAGRAAFETTCASCHLGDLNGKIGPSLRDDIWLHGDKPAEIIATISNGVPAKGMPTWGPVLGKAKITEVAAYILSFRTPPGK
jgi:cytochrome c oxidase cbb3-type subunit 3